MAAGLGKGEGKAVGTVVIDGDGPTPNEIGALARATGEWEVVPR